MDTSAEGSASEQTIYPACSQMHRLGDKRCPVRIPDLCRKSMILFFFSTQSSACDQHILQGQAMWCAGSTSTGTLSCSVQTTWAWRRGLPLAPLTSARCRLLVQPLGCFYPHFQRGFVHRHHTAHRHSSSRLDWGMPEAVPQIRALLQTAAAGRQAETSCIGVTRDFPLSAVFQLCFTS